MLINEQEAKGIANAELYIFNLDEKIKISVPLILEIHRIAFGTLYEWAGKWRTTDVMVGRLNPSTPSQIPFLIYQYVDNLNFKLLSSQTKIDHIDVLCYSHYEFIRIHPFVNGNGRTGRLIMNLVALKFGYKPLDLYQREGESRKLYIEALRQADIGDMDALKKLIEIELSIL